MPKLPVIAVIKEAVDTVWQRRKHLALPVLWLTLLMLLLDLASTHLLGESNNAFPRHAILLIRLCALVVFTVTCHRAILLENDAESRYGFVWWSARETRFLGWSLLSSLVWMATFIPVVVILQVLSLAPPADATSWRYVYHAATMLPSLYLLSRLSVLLPATALNQRHDLKWAWCLTENNGWRLTALMAVIPSLITLLDILLAGTYPLFALFGTFLSLSLTTIGVALLSVSFKRLSQIHKNPLLTENS